MGRAAVLLAALLAAAPAAAQPSELEACGQEGSTVGIAGCLLRRAEIWDRRLNEAYAALQRRITPEQRDMLRAAQRLWISYRDANCAFYAAQDGSIRQIGHAECVRATTEARARELDAAMRPGN